jgi:hypothetical protein
MALTENFTSDNTILGDFENDNHSHFGAKPSSLLASSRADRASFDQFLRSVLGYGDGDTIQIRLIPPKSTPGEVLLSKGMGYEAHGRVIPAVRDYQLVLTRNGATLTRWVNEKTEDGSPTGNKVLSNKTFNNAWAQLRRLNRQGYGVYHVVNPGGRSDSDITEARIIFAEVDLARENYPTDADHGAAVESAVKASVEAGFTTIRTDKGPHFYRKLSEPLNDLPRWSKIQQRFIQGHNADPANFNPARLMRSPGFLHWRWDGEQLVSKAIALVSLGDGESVTLENLEATLPEWDAEQWKADPTAPQAAPQAKRKSSSTNGGGVYSLDSGSAGPWSMANLVQYLDHATTEGTGRAIAHAQCPIHPSGGQSHSIDHIHVMPGGGFIAHCGCDTKLIYAEAKKRAIAAGYKPSRGSGAVGGVVASCVKESSRHDATTLDDAFTADWIAAQGLKKLSGATETSGGYIDKLPAELMPGSGADLRALRGGTGSGKSTICKTDILPAYRQLGVYVVVVVPLRSLADSFSEAYGLPILRGIGRSSQAQMELEGDIRSCGGVILCAESAHQLPEWLLQSPIHLVIDEICEVMSRHAQGDLLGRNYGRIHQAFQALVQQAINSGGGITGMDANLSDIEIDYLAQLSEKPGLTRAALNHRRTADRYQATFYSDRATWRQELMEAIRSGRVLIQSATRAQGKLIEKIAQWGGKKVLRIDGETNRDGEFSDFFKDPTGYILAGQYGVVILSPSAGYGISIQGGVSADDAYFSAVFVNADYHSTDSHLQFLDRFRPPVPRHIFCPPSIGLGRYEHRDADRINQLLNQAQNLSLGAAAAPIGHAQAAARDYLNKKRELAARQKTWAYKMLLSEVQQLGHTTEESEIELSEIERKYITQLFTEARFEIDEAAAVELAGLELEPEHTIEWAIRHAGHELSRVDELRRLKVRLIHEFPGMDFNRPATCYWMAIANRGDVAKRATLASNLAVPLAAQLMEHQEKVQQQAEATPAHKAPLRQAQVEAWHRWGLAELVEKFGEIGWTKATPMIGQIWDRLRRDMDAVLLLFGLGRGGAQQAEQQSPLHLINDLIRRAFSITSQRKGKKQERIYRLTSTPEAPLEPRRLSEEYRVDRERVAAGEIAIGRKWRTYQKAEILAAAALARSKRQAFRVVASCLKESITHDATTPPTPDWVSLELFGMTAMELSQPAPDWAEVKVIHYEMLDAPKPPAKPQPNGPQVGDRVGVDDTAFMVAMVEGDRIWLAPVHEPRCPRSSCIEVEASELAELVAA